MWNFNELKNHENEEIVLQGFVDKIRNLQYVQFVILRDSTGKEVARFTTTTDSYTLTDLSNGTYTVEEESAPAGYIKSSQKVSFTIDDQHLSHQINFVNAKETIVPNTASSSSIILTILGIAILGSGIAYVYKNSKKA